MHTAVVGIDAASATLSSVDVHAIRLAVFYIHLIVDELVAPQHDGGFDTPHHKVIVVGVGTGHILFYSKVERQLILLFAFRNNNVFHRLDLRFIFFCMRGEMPPA